MDKRANLRQHFQTEAITASTDKQYQQRTAQLKEFENTLVVAFNTLIKFLDGKTTKTEVVNQLSSISTPDMDKVVQAVSKLDKDILANKLDLKPVTDGLNGLKRELSLIPKTLPKIPEAKDSVKVTNLSEIKLDTSAVEKAIKALKLDVKAPIINTEKTDISPLKDVMLDLLKVIKDQKPVEIPAFPEIPKTDLTKVEKKLDTSNKLLKEITEKRFGGGGGGGGNGTPYIDSTGKPMNVELETDGSIPVTLAGGSPGGGVQYDAGDLVATPTGTVTLARRADDTYYPFLISDSGQTISIISDAGGSQATITGTALDVNIATEAAGLATAANQLDINTSLGGIDTKLGNPLATTSPTYLTEVDKSVTDIIYIGKATPGTATSAANWFIKKIDKTVTDAVTISYANAGAFSATWDDRLTETYS